MHTSTKLIIQTIISSVVILIDIIPDDYKLSLERTCHYNEIILTNKGMTFV